jgi:hypothetical protein
MFFNTKKTITNIIIFTTIASSLTLATLAINDFGKNKINNKSADATAPNTADLIIGKTETATNIDVSVCVRATDGPIHLTNVSHWMEFDNSALTTIPATTVGSAVPNGSLIEKGVYGNGNNGYANMKWEQVQPAPVAPSTLDKFTLRLNFIGDPQVPGFDGILMNTTPELYGKVRFTKVTGSTGSTAIGLIKNQYLSTEFGTTPITQNVINVVGDCRTSTVAATSSISSSSSMASSSLVNSSTPASSVVSSSSNNSSNVASSSVPTTVGNNTGDLIIGKTDVGNGIEVSVCVKATNGPLHLTNVSHWMEFDNSAFVPSSTILEKGAYGNSNNGYAPLKWTAVQPLPVPPSTAESWSLQLNFIGDVNVPGSNGILMSNTSPELYGKVRFDKIPGSTGTQYISLRKNVYTTREFPTTAIIQNVTNVVGDCRTSTTIASSIVSVSSSSIDPASSVVTPSSVVSSSSIIASSSLLVCNSPQTFSAGVCTNPSNRPFIGFLPSYFFAGGAPDDQIGGIINADFPIINLVYNTMTNGTPATVSINGTSLVINGTISNGSFVPNLGQKIPSNFVTGLYNGTLLALSQTLDLRFDINPAAAQFNIGLPVATIANPITGTIGTPFPSIGLINNTFANGTSAELDLPGYSPTIYGTFVNGVFVPNLGTLIPNVITGNSIANMKVLSQYFPGYFSFPQNIGIPINFSLPAGTLPNIGTTPVTTANPIGGAIGGQAPVIPLSGSNIPNGTPATFTPSGSLSDIIGQIINGNFIPNLGQIIPANSLTGASSGLLRALGLNLSVPTNFGVNTSSNNNSGGSITIGTGAGSGTTTVSTSSNPSSVSNNNLTSIPTTTQSDITITNGSFKSKLRITDPYICGVGSYGNVPDPKQFGIQNVFYDFYKAGETSPSYSFKLNLDDNGDFFLPISASTNVISEANYQVVFYALDNEGNRAQGEYTDFITDKCNDITNSINIGTVRSGGNASMIAFLLAVIAIATTLAIAKIKSKNPTMSAIFGKLK